jgi:ankyrin repeat protein
MATELERWVEAARAGDRSAFEHVVGRVQDMAVAVAYGRLGGWAANDTQFSNHIAFFLAVRCGDAAGVRTRLARDPALRDAHAHWEAEAFADRDLPMAERATPLIRAAERGHVAVIRELLDAGANIAGDCGCVTRESPLWAAVVNGQLAAATELLRRGADPNHRARSGIGCLHAAAMRGDLALVDLLLQHGADRAQCSRSWKAASQRMRRWSSVHGVCARI